jgi:hypothetical protein
VGRGFPTRGGGGGGVFFNFWGAGGGGAARGGGGGRRPLIDMMGKLRSTSSAEQLDWRLM